MSIVDIINNDGKVNKYSGLCKKSYFREKILNKIFNIKDFSAENVIGEGNCGYWSSSLQLYNYQENYNIVRTHIYTM